jgi:drug/metabolite transporter (DMT)-like permease
MALAHGRVVIGSPIVATTPLFSLLISLIFLRGKEQLTGRTILGTLSVIAGTVAIALGKSAPTFILTARTAAAYSSLHKMF